MQPIHLFTLSNGLRCAFLPTASPVSYCALTTLAGTRFEPQGLMGLAHYCEHMLFKGTQKRNSYHINNRLERLGGDINAFTTKEELVLHTTVLTEDTPKAMELLSDLAFHSTIPDKEALKERQVILDEIRTYKDSPMDLIYDRFEELLFAGTPMATPILGTAKSLAKIKPHHMRAFMNERFRPTYMALSLVGNFTPKRAEYLAEKFFGASVVPGDSQVPAPALLAEAEDTPQEMPGASEMPQEPLTESPVPVAPFHIEEHRNAHQVHCLMGSTAYNLFQKGRIPLVLLMNLLGGPASNARLNMILREKYGLVYMVEATYAPYALTGFAGIYFGTDKSKLDQCRELVRSILDSYSQQPLTPLQLERAKKQLIGQMAISANSHEAQCLGMGKSLLSYGDVPSHKETVELIRAVTAEQVLEVAREIWDPARGATLLFV